MKKTLKMLGASVILASVVTTSVCAEGYKVDYEIFIEPVYDAVDYFDEGLAAVSLDGKWGYINMNGDFLIEPAYDYASCFSEGKALVGNLGTATAYSGEAIETLTLGILDSEGGYTPLMVPTDEGGVEQLTIDTYEYKRDDGSQIKYAYNNGFLVIPNGMEVRADTSASEIIFDRECEWFDSSFGYSDINGMSVEELYMSGVYSDGLFYGMPTMGLDTPNQVYVTKDKEIFAAFPRWPHITDKNYVVEQVYEFVNGYAGAWGLYKDTYEYFFMLINKQGEIVFTGDYQSVSRRFISGECGWGVVNDGIVVLKDKAGKAGAVDVNGNTVIPFIYDDMMFSTEGLCAAEKDGKWGYVNGDGQVVIDLQYDRAGLFNDGIALVEKDGVATVIDRYNNILEGSDGIPLDSYFKEGSIASISDTMIVEKDGKFGFAKLTYNIGLPMAEEMSVWAYPEVVEAIEANLVPMYLRNNYFDNITRMDFAQLIMRALEEVTGKDARTLLAEHAGLTMAQAYATNKFEDTSDENVVIANKIGIINGISDLAFAPEKNIVRQDAAALLMRAAKLISGDIEIAETSFEDEDSIADYAKQAVSYVTTLKIMNGVGQGKFDPASTYTREQAYVTIVRLFKSLKN